MRAIFSVYIILTLTFALPAQGQAETLFSLAYGAWARSSVPSKEALSDFLKANKLACKSVHRTNRENERSNLSEWQNSGVRPEERSIGDELVGVLRVFTLTSTSAETSLKTYDDLQDNKVLTRHSFYRETPGYSEETKGTTSFGLSPSLQTLLVYHFTETRSKWVDTQYSQTIYRCDIQD
jgi:hypothetical protein